MTSIRASGVTAFERKKLIESARKGLSFAGCANIVGKSRNWLTAARAADEDLDRAMLQAVSEYEEELIEARARCIRMVTDAEPSAALIGVITATLAQRFPQRHGQDPRLRYDTTTAAEERLEDLPNTKVQTPGLDVSSEELRAYLRSQLDAQDKR